MSSILDALRKREAEQERLNPLDWKEEGRRRSSYHSNKSVSVFRILLGVFGLIGIGAWVGLFFFHDEVMTILRPERPESSVQAIPREQSPPVAIQQSPDQVQEKLPLTQVTQESVEGIAPPVPVEPASPVVVESAPLPPTPMPTPTWTPIPIPTPVPTVQKSFSQQIAEESLALESGRSEVEILPPAQPVSGDAAILIHAPKSQAPTFHLNGIFYNDRNPMAIVNNRLVGVGDTVEGRKVLAISPNSVRMEGVPGVLTLEQ